MPTLSPDQFLYHGSPPENRASIRQHGLLAEHSESGGTWFHSDRAKLAEGMGGKDKGDVWRVKAKNVPHVEHGSNYSFEHGPDAPVYATSAAVPKVQRVKIR